MKGEAAEQSRPVEAPEMLTLLRPSTSTVTTVYTITGRNLNVGLDGTVDVTHEESIGLMQAGWQRVERVAA